MNRYKLSLYKCIKGLVNYGSWSFKVYASLLANSLKVHQDLSALQNGNRRRFAIDSDDSDSQPKSEAAAIDTSVIDTSAIDTSAINTSVIDTSVSSAVPTTATESQVYVGHLLCFLRSKVESFYTIIAPRILSPCNT